MDDYERFVQMLYLGGALGNTRILGRKTLEFMTADHLGPNVRIGNHLPAGAGTWLRARLRGSARGRNGADAWDAG